MTSILRIVDRVSAAAVTLLDLNEHISGPRITMQSASFPTPSMSVTPRRSPFGDGTVHEDTALDNRACNLSLLVSGSDAPTRDAKIQDLMALLNNDSVILEWRPQGATKSLFFCGLRSPEVVFTRYELHNTEPVAELAVTIMAQPYALELPVFSPSEVAWHTISWDWAAANGGFLDINNVDTDAPTPALITLGDPGSSGTVLLSVRRGGTPSQVPYVVQAESLTVDIDTTIVSGDAAFSGGSYASTSYATQAGSARRLRRNLPVAGSSAGLRGLYRVFLRARTQVGTRPRVQMKVGNDVAGVLATLQNRPAADTASMQFIDLGLIQFPASSAPAQQGHGYLDINSGVQFVEMFSDRQGGAGSLQWDVLLFVPADTEMCVLTYGNLSGSQDRIIWDGPNNATYAVGSDGAKPVSITRTGLVPMLGAGSNRLFVIPNLQAGHTITPTSSYRVGYWPRRLAVAGS